MKLPLSALRLMNERNKDRMLREEMQEPLERIQQYLNTMMMSSKLKKPENDVKLEKVSLREAAAEAVKNHSYFLIRDDFNIELHVKDITVYSDRRWLVYMLDQMIGNAVKYRGKAPKLTFGAETLSDHRTIFWTMEPAFLRRNFPIFLTKVLLGAAGETAVIVPREWACTL